MSEGRERADGTLLHRDEDWPHGLRCAQCKRLMSEGDCYSERLESFIEDSPVCLIVCEDCALSGAGR